MLVVLVVVETGAAVSGGSGGGGAAAAVPDAVAASVAAGEFVAVIIALRKHKSMAGTAVFVFLTMHLFGTWSYWYEHAGYVVACRRSRRSSTRSRSRASRKFLGPDDANPMRLLATSPRTRLVVQRTSATRAMHRASATVLVTAGDSTASESGRAINCRVHRDGLDIFELAGDLLRQLAELSRHFSLQVIHLGLPGDGCKG